MRLCTKCILPETFPSIKFDADGVCNYCRNYKGHEHNEELKAQYREKFESLLAGLGLSPAPCTLNPVPSPSSPAPGPLNPDPSSSGPCTLNPVPSPSSPAPGPLNPDPSSSAPSTLNPEPSPYSPAPLPLNPEPSSSRPCTLNPAPSYHVLMAYSGGKDSTYTLDIFKNKYKLNALALTFDNGFISPFAIENMKKVCDALGVDHLLYKPQFKVLKKIFTASVKENIYSKKSLERSSTICSSCIGLVKSITLKLALEKNIPFIGYGWSPGQAPVQSAVMKINADFIRSSQKAFYDPMHKRAGDEIAPYFLDESDFAKLASGNYYNVHPLAFLDYSEEAIFKRITELGWQHPKDTDSNSSNCLLNGFANQTHIDAYGFHPYAFEIAGLVRTGVMSREEGLEKIEMPQNEEVIRRVKEKLGI